ncbi:MAG: sigma-70 family RNA polymerase sigma factor [Terriglobales bacterium]
MSSKATPAAWTAASQSASWTPGEFEAMFTAHYPRLAARLRLLVGERAEDVAQEAFVRLYRNPPPEREQVAAWLHRVAGRAAIDLLRRQQRQDKYERAAAREAPPATGPDAEQAALAAERQARARACLARLPRRQAQLLWLRYAGGSYQEIAQNLGVRVTSVGAMLARAEAAFARAYPRTAAPPSAGVRESKSAADDQGGCNALS